MHFLVPCGTTGESPTLDARERRRVVELVVEAAAGRVPVMAGAGGYDTREVIHAVGEMAKAGATGILSVSPYYNKPTQEGLYQHYRRSPRARRCRSWSTTSPGRTGSNVETATLVRLAEIPNIIGVKEASGNIAQICDVRRHAAGRLPGRCRGDDAITLPVMSVGGQGVISVAGNEIPGEMARMVEAVERNDWAAARALHHRLPAADDDQLRRVEPDPGEGGDGPDGPARRSVPAADGVAVRGVAPPHRARAGRPRAAARGRRGARHEPARAASSRLVAEKDLTARRDEARAAFAELRQALSDGSVRAAEPDASTPTGWRVNTWVKQGILLGFRSRRARRRRRPTTGAGRSSTRTRCRCSTFTVADNVRVVPGGSTIRDGAYVAPGVICMPPMYINIGAYVGEGTLIDSHALVGSCAQIGRHVHISAAAQIGGVIEPVGALPVIIEDDVLVGGNTGVYEGAVVKARAVIAAGTVLTGSTPVYDLPNGRIIKPEAGPAAGRAGRRGGRARRARRHGRRRQGLGPVARHAGHRQVPRRPHRHPHGARAVDPVAPLGLVGLTRRLVDIDSTTGQEARVRPRASPTTCAGAASP